MLLRQTMQRKYNEEIFDKNFFAEFLIKMSLILHHVNTRNRTFDMNFISCRF